LRTGSELRPYGFALLGGALGALGAVQVDSTVGWLCLASGAAIALGSHFATAALVPGWLVLSGFGARPLLALAPGLALLLASLWTQRDTVRRAAAAWWMPAPTPRRLWRQLAVLGGGGQLGGAAALGVVGLVGIGCAVELGARFGLAAALGFATLMTLSVLARPVVWPRTLMLLQPFAFVAAGVGVALLARWVGAPGALLALALVVVATARRIHSASWAWGEEPWTVALADARAAEPATAIAACPPWAALGVEQALPRAPVLRLPLALDRDAALALAARLAGERRLILVVRVDALLLGRERGLDSFLAGLAESHLERLRLTLVESPDREILTELCTLASGIRSSAVRSWAAPVSTRSGPGFEVLELARRGGTP
jgi:hypothetical protein